MNNENLIYYEFRGGNYYLYYDDDDTNYFEIIPKRNLKNYFGDLEKYVNEKIISNVKLIKYS